MKKKVVSSILAMTMVSSMLMGCGGSAQETEKKEVKKEEGGKEDTVKLKWAVKASEAGRAEFEQMAEMAEKECGVEIEIVALPDPEAGEANKLLISLMAGDEFDIVEDAYSNMKQFYEANVIEDMGALAEAAGYDVQEIFGDYPAKFDDKIYGLPAYVDKALTIYNKDLFDKANIPYPTAEDWTWEKFIEIGK